ncbi:putative nuclease HARBI1 [Metopolophium dirhodum]|uniref:putative nuclease HARBI1 n=1 Tax=Metopolophium dirhodum TaxID=44670 RepID=UPI00298FA41A|nr:putative nuclease HARBI1 [Metopolophium dirhodum]
MAHNTIGKIIYETCNAIWEVFSSIHMPFPSTELFEQIAYDFEKLWKFPNCIGCIDSKHIRIKCPNNSGSMFYNYKGYFSVHLQGVCDAKYKFISVDIGAYGRQSDSGIFTESNIFKNLEAKSFNVPNYRPLPNTTTPMPFVLLGDQGYPLKEYLLRPYPFDKNLDSAKETFNYRLSKARRMIECTFGILVSKWRCLKTELQMNPEHVDIVIKTICLLHNIIIDKEGIDETLLEQVRRDPTINSETHSVSRRNNRSRTEAYIIRDTFKDYFTTVGAIK